MSIVDKVFSEISSVVQDILPKLDPVEIVAEAAIDALRTERKFTDRVVHHAAEGLQALGCLQQKAYPTLFQPWVKPAVEKIIQEAKNLKNTERRKEAKLEKLASDLERRENYPEGLLGTALYKIFDELPLLHGPLTRGMGLMDGILTFGGLISKDVKSGREVRREEIRKELINEESQRFWKNVELLGAGGISDWSQIRSGSLPIWLYPPISPSNSKTK